MKIFLEKKNKYKSLEIKEKITFKELIKKLKISCESSILVKNNKIVLEDEILCNLDEVKILSVVSGG